MTINVNELAARIAELREMTTDIHVYVEYGNSVAYADMDDWQRQSNPWTVTLFFESRQMTVDFWTGSALGEPDARTVVECMANDATTLDYKRFEEWAADYGYDEDSRAAERTFQEVRHQAHLFKDLLGSWAWSWLQRHNVDYETWARAMCALDNLDEPLTEHESAMLGVLADDGKGIENLPSEWQVAFDLAAELALT